MAIQHFVSVATDCLHDHGANGDVGHKTAVHDIDVDPVASSSVDGTDLQGTEAGVEEGLGQTYR